MRGWREKRGGGNRKLAGIATTQARDDCALDEDGGGGGGEKWMESSHFLKVQLTGFPDRPDVGGREGAESRIMPGILA